MLNSLAGAKGRLPLSDSVGFSRNEASATYELTQGQLAIWTAQALDWADPGLNIGDRVEIRGELDRDIFERALRRAVAEADALHLRVIVVEDQPRQSFHFDREWTLQQFDFRRSTIPAREAESWMRRDMDRPFALESGPLFRFALLRVADDRHYWYAVNHHFVNDGVGWTLLLRRIITLYARMAGGAPDTGVTLTSFRALLDEERAYRKSTAFERDRTYWLNRLRHRPQPVSLSLKMAAPMRDVTQVTGSLSNGVNLAAIGGMRNIRPAVVLIAAVALYLHRTTSAVEIVLGMQVAARLGKPARSAVGLAVNVVPLRVSVSPTDSFNGLLDLTARAMRDALRHQMYRAEDLRRDLRLAPHDSDLYSAFVNYTPLDETFKFPDCETRRRPLGNWRVDDLEFVFYGGSDPAGQRIDLIGNSARYDAAGLQRHLDSFLALLAHCHQWPNAECGEAPAPGAIDRRNGLAHIDTASETSSPTTQPPSARLDIGVAPLHLTEQFLEEIWRDVLKVKTIDRNDDFFDLGGHSLLATQVMARIQRVFGITLPLRILFAARTLRAQAEQIGEALADRQFERALPIERVADDQPVVLSYSQQRMWTIHSLDPESSAYNLSGAILLTGDLDVVALGQAFDALRVRHEVLRARFTFDHNEIRQEFEPARSEPLEATDLRRLGDAALAEAIRLSESVARAPFDLAIGPIMRVSLVRVGDDSHALQVTIHHIAGDQWSLNVLTRELAHVYNAVRARARASLEPLRIRYRDYAAWQRRLIEDDNAGGFMGYWRAKLAGVPPLDLPTDFPRPPVRSLRGSCVMVALPDGLVARLEALSRREGATLFMTTLAAFALQLRRLANQRDFAIAVPIANRTQSETENLIGTFVNTLALRFDLTQEPTLRELLARTKTLALEAYSHQNAPYDRLVHELASVRDSGRSPLAQVMFNMLNTPFQGLSLGDLTWEPLVLDRGGAQFELSVSIDAQISNSVAFDYSTDLFQRETIERYATQYIGILESFLEAPGDSVIELSTLAPAERRLLLETWNDTSSTSAQDLSFVRLFERLAAQRPDAPAIVFEGRIVCYSALNLKAEAIAQRLRAAGIGPGVGVGVHVGRSVDLVATLIGVQKAGGYYLPLDPNFPPGRLEYMLADSGVRVLVADSDLESVLTTPPGATTLILNAIPGLPDTQGELGGGRLGEPDDPVYIIYTSGSTGRPKGVVVRQRSLTNFLHSMAQLPGLTHEDRLVALTSISFDIAGLELFLPLSVGGSLVLASKSVATDGKALGAILCASGANVLQATPVTWRMLIETGWRGGPSFRALCGGEALSRDLADSLLDRVGELWNLYGPTETTIWSTVGRIAADGAPISIGRPIANTRIYIAGENGDLAPIGVPGEIWIGGSGVASGYQGRPDLTAEKFLDDPFTPVAGQTIYRTGDLGRWGPDGRLYHLGRLDTQVKVRGYRIETSEIEVALRAQSSVRNAVVVARDLGAGDSRLVAYVVFEARETIPVGDMRRHLRQILPEYMVPSVIVSLDALPVTPNGKIDRRALPDPFEDAAPSESRFIAPAPGLEDVLANIWKELLKLPRVSARDNFIELGGHSLLALRVAALLRARTGHSMDPRTLFFQSLRRVAESVAASEAK